MLKKILTIGMLFLFQTNAFAFSGSPPLKNENPVRWEEIKTWKSIGPKWALGLDQNQQPLAFYDLSYDDHSSRIFLGCIDFDCANYDQIISLLRSKMSLSISSEDEKKESSQVVQALLQLKSESQTDVETEKNPLPRNWWKSVIWKKNQGNHVFSDSSEAPQSFLLSQIDFDTIVKEKKEFKRILELLGGEDFLDHFEFIKTEKGGYRFYWKGVSGPSAPLKIADFKCPQCQMNQDLSQDGVSALLSQLIGQIPVPLLASFLNIAIGEWNHFKVELQRFHQNEAIEMLLAAEDQRPTDLESGVRAMHINLSPFSELTPEIRERIAENIYYSQSDALTALGWLTKNPKDSWIEDRKKIRASATQLKQDLEKQGLELSLLNPRYAIASDGNQNRWLYPLASPRYWNLVPPFIAVDYQNSFKTVSERASVEAANVLVQFLSGMIPLPLVGSLMAKLFEGLIHSQMHLVQHWEARLNSHLQLRQFQLEDWKLEMQRLRIQSVNPFVPSWEEVVQRVQARKESLGLK